MRLRVSWVAGALLAAPLAAQTPASGGYVDPSTCAQCHARIAQSYARTGMGRSFRAVRPDTVLQEFDSAWFSHSASGEQFTPVRRDGKHLIRREAPAGYNRLDVAVNYVMGSGDHARSYLHRTPDGKLVQLPVSWYSANGGHWGMSPGYDRPGHQGLSREVPYRCMFCHNGYPEVDARAAEWDGGTMYPERLPEGIDCQRCHGPGRNHVETARQGGTLPVVRGSIVNPARLSPERRMEVCLQCHLESTSSPLPAALMRFGRSTFSYSAGEPLGDFLVYFDHAPGSGFEDKFEIVSAAYRFRKSACFQRSDGEFGCTTCHDPHRALARREIVEKSNRTCRGCHAADALLRAQQGRHPTGGDCVACHMPLRIAEDVIHVRITDHQIARFPSPVKVPEREEIKKPYAGEVALYYPKDVAPTQENKLLLAIAQVKQLSHIPEGLRGLESLLEQIRPRVARPYFELGQAFLTAGQPGHAVPFFREAVTRDPQDWRYLYGLAQGLQASAQPAAALDAYQRAVALTNDPAAVLLAMAGAYAEQGNLSSAAAALRQVLGRNPESAAAQARLGNVLLRSGDLDGAERVLREAVRWGPEAAAVRINLADVLIAAGKLDGARNELSWALRSGPSIEEAQGAWYRALAGTGSMQQALSGYEASLRAQLAPVHLNLGTVMMMQGDSNGALREYQLAVASDPSSGAALTNLALALMARGDAAGAREKLEEAVRADPNLLEAHLHLGELLLALGETASGTAHLERAAESPDPRVRRPAADLLRRK